MVGIRSPHGDQRGVGGSESNEGEESGISSSSSPPPLSSKFRGRF